MAATRSATAPAGGPGANGPAPGLAARTFFGLGWAGIASGGQALLSLCIMMILARVLAPADFGLMAMALALVAPAELVARRSIGPALVQRDTLDEGHVATGLTLGLALGGAAAATLFVFAPALGDALGEPRLAPVLRTIAPVLLLGALAIGPEHLLRRHLRFRPLTAAALGSQAIGSGLVAVVLALLGHGVWALVWGVLARHAVFALVVLRCRPPPLRLRLRRREAAALLVPGAGFSAIALLNSLSAHGARLGLASTLGTAALGLYTAAERLARAPAVLSPALGEVAFSAMSRRQRHPERIEAVAGNGVELLLLAGLPAGAAIAVAAPEIVAVVLGAQWEAAVPALRILAIGVALQAGSVLHVAAIRARGAVYRETWRRALHPLLLAGCIWAGSPWGLAGVAAGLAGAGVAVHLLLVQLSCAEIGLRPRTVLRCHLPGLWVALWATPALWLALAWARDAGAPALGALALGLAAWAAAAVWALRVAPRFARAGSLAWALDRLPLAELGVPGRLLRAAAAAVYR